MAAPVVQGRASGIQSTNATSHAITLPTGIVNGELLVVVFTEKDAGNWISTTSTGWNIAGAKWIGTTPNGVFATVFTKIATGSDALTVTIDFATQSTHVSFRISGARGMLIAQSAANASLAAADPPNLDMGVSDDYLWIAARCAQNVGVPASAPTNYANLTNKAGGASGASTSTAERTLTAASENPGAFASTTAVATVSFTICVLPAVVPGATPNGCPVLESAVAYYGQAAPTTTMAVAVPHGAAINDIMVALVYMDPSAATMTPPSGWTELPNSPVVQSTTHDIHAYWKRLTAADTGKYSFTSSGSNWGAIIARFSGAITTGTPFDTLTSAAKASSASSVTGSPAVSGTPAGAGRTLIWCAADFNIGNWVMPSGYAKAGDDSAGNVIGWKPAPSVVASGSLTGTATAAGAITALLGALIGNPARAGDMSMAA